MIMQNTLNQAAVISRREPAAISALVLNWEFDARLKKLIGPLFREIKRRDFNKRHRLLLEWLVECTLARGRCWVYASSLERLAGPLGFGRSAVHEILHGAVSPMGSPVAGLVELGCVRVRECADGGWLLVLVPDASRWGVVAAYSAEMHAVKVADADTVCAQFAAQLESGSVADWFPDLDVVMDAVRLEEALTVAGGGRKVVQPADAPRVLGRRESACESRGRSEYRNAETLGNARGVPKFGTSPTTTRARACASVKPVNSIKQKTVQPLNSVTRGDDSNRLLAELEVEFARVHGEAAARKEMINSGACWRLIARRWPDEFEQQVGALRIFLNEGGKVKRAAWFYLQHYFTQAIGLSSWSSVCEKSKESFNPPMKAR